MIINYRNNIADLHIPYDNATCIRIYTYWHKRAFTMKNMNGM